MAAQAQRLRENLRAWESLDETGRQLAIARFLSEPRATPSAHTLLATLSAYVRGISYEFDSGFLRTLEAYRKLLSVQSS